MNFAKYFFGFALIAFCCISLVFTRKCYVCDDINSCSKPGLYDCTPFLAIATLVHMNRYHSGNISNIFSSKYDCFKEYLVTNYSETYYKGCAYANTNFCKVPISPSYAPLLKKQSCSVCSKDKCNPAGRARIDVMTVLATIAIVTGIRCIWN